VIRSEELPDEGGFTLIEMMIAIGVLSIVIVPLIGSFLMGILETSSAEERTADSVAAQLASSYLISDIESSETISFGSPVCAASGTSLLSMTWNAPSATGSTLVLTPYKVDYVDQVVSGRHELHRWICIGADAPSEALVVFNLNSSSASAFTVTCSDGAACANPTSVKIHLEAFSQAPGEGSSYKAAGPFKIEFTAVRRFGVGT
jgi:prepilin-type N-terminal cleavage/methylation domain-containing protein